MPSLTLLRHAKSSWADAGLDDHDRTLNERGRRDAPAVATELGRHAPPTRVLCSSALRTRQTLQHLVDAGVVDPERVRIEPDLYLASAETIEALIGTDDHLLVIGHNPGIEELAGRLAGRALTLKTSSLCRYERADAGGRWQLIEQLTPRG